MSCDDASKAVAELNHTRFPNEQFYMEVALDHVRESVFDVSQHQESRLHV